MQLPTGELPSRHWSDSGDSYSAPVPLLSALAYQALAYVDPRSRSFVARLRDLVPPSFFRDVVTIRWGLRLYIASEEEPEGMWRLHGRSSSRGPDVSTTACGATVLLPAVRSRSAAVDRRHVKALERLGEREWRPIEAAHVLRYLSSVGADCDALEERVRRDAAVCAEADPAYAQAVAAAVPDVAVAVRSNGQGRLADALATAALLDVKQEGQELDDALGRILLDTTPPSLWPADRYGDEQVGSAAVALAFNVSNVARLTTTPRGEQR